MTPGSALFPAASATCLRSGHQDRDINLGREITHKIPLARKKENVDSSLTFKMRQGANAPEINPFLGAHQ